MNLKKTLVTALLTALLAISALFKPNINEAATPEQIETFISGIAPYAVDTACENPGLYPSVMIAQACLETGYGQHVPQNNIFGIKSLANKPKQELKTTEVIHGEKVVVTDQFAVFQDYADAFASYAALLMNAPVYQGVRTAGSPEAAAHALTGTYATDPKYARSLLWIINAFNLRRFDEQATQTTEKRNQEANATPVVEKEAEEDVTAVPLTNTQESPKETPVKLNETTTTNANTDTAVPTAETLSEEKRTKNTDAITSTNEKTPDTKEEKKPSVQDTTATTKTTDDASHAKADTASESEGPVKETTEAPQTTDKSVPRQESVVEPNEKNRAMDNRKNTERKHTVAKKTTVLAEYQKPAEAPERPLIELPDTQDEATPVGHKKENAEKESVVKLANKQQNAMEAPFTPEQVPNSVPVLPILIFVLFTVCVTAFGIKKLN